jgi:hypothetical protein
MFQHNDRTIPAAIVGKSKDRPISGAYTGVFWAQTDHSKMNGDIRRWVDPSGKGGQYKDNALL